MADLNNLAQAIIDAINAAQAANVANNAAQQPPVPPPGQFALVPGMNNQLPLDFNKSEDIKFFNKVIVPVDDKFDLKEENLRAFLDVVQERARIYNLTNVLNVPDMYGTLFNLVTNYGQLTMPECVEFAEEVINEESRRAQNDMMLYQFLSNSLTADARLKLVANPTAYTVNETPSGLLFLKVLIGRSSIDTKAKTLLLRTEISSLPSKMVEMKGNVREFNVYVEHKRQQLLGRGQNVDELIAHLFTAYLKVPDSDFIRYIQSKKDMFEEGNDIDADELMNLALVRYDLILQQNAANSEGVEDRVVAFMGKTDAADVLNQDERFDAMIAKLQGIQDKMKGNGNGKNRRNQKNDPKNAWKQIKPTDHEPQSKTVNGRLFNWCKYHNMWTMHKPSECTLGKNQGQSGKDAHNKNYNAQDNNLQLSRALLAMMHSNDEDEESND